MVARYLTRMAQLDRIMAKLESLKRTLVAADHTGDQMVQDSRTLGAIDDFMKSDVYDSSNDGTAHLLRLEIIADLGQAVDGTGLDLVVSALDYGGTTDVWTP
jgi:hypothetical protein